jgi:hypothetical protein
MPSDSAPARWSLESLLWGVAHFALVLTGVSTPTNAAGLGGLIVGGLVVWTVAFIRDARQSVEKPRDAQVVSVSFLVFAIVDFYCAAMLYAPGAQAQVIWFAVAGLFAVMAIAAARVRAPSDVTYLAQLWFQFSMALPAFFLLVKLAVRYTIARPPAIPFDPADAVTPVVMFAVMVILMPINVLFILALMGLEFRRAKEDRAYVWETLSVHQLAYVILSARGVLQGHL